MAQTTTAVINVVVTDQNDNAPMFEKKTFFVNVSENTRVGTKVFNLRAVDTDLGVNGLFTYHLLAGSGDGVFNINLTSGKTKPRLLRPKCTLEITRFFELKCIIVSFWEREDVTNTNKFMHQLCSCN